MASGGPPELIDTLRLTQEQWQDLAHKLEQVDQNIISQRQFKRIPYRKFAKIAAAIRPPEGEWGKFIVRTHDLSTGGIGIIHGTYIPIGSTCRVILKDRHDKIVCLEGVVKHCEHIQGTAHDIGVAFNEEIDINIFITTDEATPDAG